MVRALSINKRSGWVIMQHKRFIIVLDDRDNTLYNTIYSWENPGHINICYAFVYYSQKLIDDIDLFDGDIVIFSSPEHDRIYNAIIERGYPASDIVWHYDGTVKDAQMACDALEVIWPVIGEMKLENTWTWTTKEKKNFVNV